MAASLRQTIIGRLKARLEQRGYPRLQMLLLVALTGGVGFLCSTLMLWSGVNEMWLRYLVSVGAAYLAFLGLLWLWMRVSAPSYVDPRDLTRLDAADPAWDDAWRENESSGYRPSLWDIADAELGLALPVLLLVFLGATLVATCYIVYAAPVLFAELMLDGVLAITLYRRLRTLDVRHWLQTALRRTFSTFLLAGVILVVAGLGMSEYAPEAKSLGDVLTHWTR